MTNTKRTEIKKQEKQPVKLKEDKFEKALILGNDEILAAAIRDILKKDEMDNGRLN